MSNPVWLPSADGTQLGEFVLVQTGDKSLTLIAAQPTPQPVDFTPRQARELAQRLRAWADAVDPLETLGPVSVPEQSAS
jgi:hypothetical protein